MFVPVALIITLCPAYLLAAEDNADQSAKKDAEVLLKMNKLMQQVLESHKDGGDADYKAMLKTLQSMEKQMQNMAPHQMAPQSDNQHMSSAMLQPIYVLRDITHEATGGKKEGETGNTLQPTCHQLQPWHIVASMVATALIMCMLIPLAQRHRSFGVTKWTRTSPPRPDCDNCKTQPQQQEQFVRTYGADTFG